jgi:exopolysaccharide production protein ExoQ
MAQVYNAGERTMAKAPLSSLEKIVLCLVLVLANFRALVFVFLFPDLSNPFGVAWIEILLWMLAVASVLYLLLHNRQLSTFLALWRRNWLLLLFIGLAFLSIFWSVSPLATLFRTLELAFATLIAAYFGIRLLPQRMMGVLFWFGALVFILSIALVYGAPPTGTMYWRPFNGAWRGLYWHRNHLASITAFLSAIYLCRLILGIQSRNAKSILDGVLYVLSLVVLYFSKSATGYIVFIVLNLSVLVILLWLRIYNHLKRIHYLLLLGVGSLAGLLALINLNTIFGLFNRDATMTGRIGLWSHLVEVASPHLWLGHGFGAVWTLDAFREEIRLLVGWASQPLIGDNGFLDIYLHLGIIGLALFVGILVLFTVRAIRYALTQKALTSFFPLLVLLYAIFANITFSLFIETEVFVWFLITASLFMTTSSTVKPVS